MEAHPCAGPIQRNQEEVARAERPQQLVGVVGADQRLRERRADSVEHRNAEHERARALVQTRQHRFAQVVDHAAVGAGELRDELCLIVCAGKRQRDEFERSGPAFGLGQQLLQIRWRQVAPEATAVELRCFIDVELHLSDVELEQLAPYPEPAQPQAGLLSAPDHVLDGSRRVVHEPIDDLEHIGFLDELQVVQEQDDAALDRLEVAGQHLQQRLRAGREITREVSHDGLADPRIRLLQRGDEVPHEARLVVVGFVERQPGTRNPALDQLDVPSRHQRGLAIAGRGSNDHDRVVSVEYFARRIEPGSRQRPSRSGGGVQLAFEDRCLESCAGHDVVSA